MFVMVFMNSPMYGVMMKSLKSMSFHSFIHSFIVIIIFFSFILPQLLLSTYICCKSLPLHKSYIHNMRVSHNHMHGSANTDLLVI